MHRTIDGFQHPVARPQSPIGELARRPLPIPSFAHKPTTTAALTPQQPVKTPRKRTFEPVASDRIKPSFWERFQMPLIVLGCMLAGFFVQSLVFGMLSIAAYGIAMFVFHINSRVTFTLAFISLITVVALLLIKQDVNLASNFATYTFLLLVLGVIALSLEARPQVRRKRRSGR
jgi:hypothetical protein